MERERAKRVEKILMVDAGTIIQEYMFSGSKRIRRGWNVTFRWKAAETVCLYQSVVSTLRVYTCCVVCGWCTCVVKVT